MTPAWPPSSLPIVHESLQKELFHKLFDAAPDPIVIVDDEGKIILINAEAERKFGYKATDLLLKPLEILMPERFRNLHQAYRKRYNLSPGTRPMGRGLELFACHQDGSEFPVEISLSPVHVGSELLIISIIRDITDRKATEHQLQIKAAELEHSNRELSRSNQELEQFAYVASHDLQEPLRSIAGSCQMLQRKLGDNIDPTIQEFINFAVEGSKRLQDLINDLLSYSRVTTKAKEPTLVSSKAILERVIYNLRTAIEDSHAQIIAGNLPEVQADQSQLTQLLQNFIGNAIKFRSEQNPIVSVDAVADGKFWRFSIADNGIGIEAKYFERIFEIFKRLHVREKYPGTGIGLATCKKIVERHGGKIWLQSILGQGSTFYFTLPQPEHRDRV